MGSESTHADLHRSVYVAEQSQQAVAREDSIMSPIATFRVVHTYPAFPSAALNQSGQQDYP